MKSLRSYTVILLILLFGGVFGAATAQQIYETQQGKISIFGFIDELPVTAHSHQLEITLDYDQAFFELKLPVSSLYLGIDSLDKKLREKENDFIGLKGKLGIESINTKDHLPQHFEFSGIMNHNYKSFSVIGEGNLQHIVGGDVYACLLGLNFELNPADLVLEYPGANKSIKIQVKQTVLNLARKDN